MQLTKEEKAALWAVVDEWARGRKMAGINTAVHKKRISEKPAPKPWPTAAQIWEQVQRLGQAENPSFVVDEWLHEPLLALCLYFGQDAIGFEELDPSFSLEKGILLYGPVGCGKTKILELIGRVDPRLSFRVFPCPDVSSAYRKDGDAALAQYGAPVTMGFDDLGFEDANAKNYGNSANPLADILTKRYALRPRPLTHATTNDDAAAMLAKYGDRVYSRMAELFNIVQFSPDAPDRRQPGPRLMQLVDDNTQQAA